jgi:hypothetical protein
MSKPLSNRQKKQVVQEGLRRLMAKPGWNREVPNEGDAGRKMMQLDQLHRDDALRSETSSCPACEKIRTDLDDETALCEQHLAQVMGF